MDPAPDPTVVLESSDDGLLWTTELALYPPKIGEVLSVLVDDTHATVQCVRREPGRVGWRVV